MQFCISREQLKNTYQRSVAANMYGAGNNIFYLVCIKQKKEQQASH